MHLPMLHNCSEMLQKGYKWNGCYKLPYKSVVPNLCLLISIKCCRHGELYANVLGLVNTLLIPYNCSCYHKLVGVEVS